MRTHDLIYSWGIKPILRQAVTQQFFKLKKTKIQELYSHSLLISKVPYNINLFMYQFFKCPICNVKSSVHVKLFDIDKY